MKGIILLYLVSSIFLFNLISAQDGNAQLPIEELHSFAPPFLMGVSSIPNWDYGGSTIATEELVRLVPAMRSKEGWLWNTEPVRFDSWEVEIEFQIHNTRSPGADGMAFWVSKDRVTSGGPLYGMPELFDGLGIVFDTYDNDGARDNPRVVAIRNDGTPKVWDIPNDLKENQLASCMSFYRNTREHVKARITYNQNNLQVSLDTDNSGTYQYCFSVENLNLPQGYYFGLTAATGALSDYHDIFSFTTRNLNKKTVNVVPDLNRNRRGSKWWDPYKNQQQQNNNNQPPADQQNQEVPPMPTPAVDDAMEQRLKSFRQRLEQQRLEKQEPAVEQQNNQQQQNNEQQNNQQQQQQQQDTGVRSTQNEQPKQTSSEDTILIISTLQGIKQELNNLKAQVSSLKSIDTKVQGISNKQAEFSEELAVVKRSIQTEVSSLVDKLKLETNILNAEVKKLDKSIENINGEISRLGDKTNRYTNNVEKSTHDLKNVIKNESGWNIWTYVILLVPSLVFGSTTFILWKKLNSIDRARKYL